MQVSCEAFLTSAECGPVLRGERLEAGPPERRSFRGRLTWGAGAATHGGMSSQAPVLLAEILRGGVVESRHFGCFVVSDDEGRVVASGGDPDMAVFPRSAIKALQALPLVAEGAADRFGLSDAELALACASHTGLPEHADAAASMLARAGRDFACLECGTHWPSSASATRALAALGKAPSALHNNCSGKHAGFVCLALAAGDDPAGYVAPDHPTMARVTRAVAAMTGASLTAANRAVDGCSIPTFAVPLRSVATGFARFGTGRHVPAGFAAAAARLRRAAAANPAMLAGPGRFDTAVTAALGEAAFVKTGAEGVHAGALPGLGLGFAVKVVDGSNRAADACAAALLGRFLGGNAVLEEWAQRPLVNWNGVPVGMIAAKSL
jgi:L-asparaginase II